MKFARINLRKKSLSGILGRHPWIRHDHILTDQELPSKATVVDLFVEDKAMARAFYNPASRLSLRILSLDPDQKIDASFIRLRLQEAVKWRSDLNLNSNAYRLFHSESDGLPGLIVDLFNDVVVVQVSSLFIHEQIELVCEDLKNMLPGKHLRLNYDHHFVEREGIDLATLAQTASDIESTTITENGLQYHIDFTDAQKTGFFLDQRDNRSFLRDFVESKRVLDLCSYSGGFAINASKFGAGRVAAVDSSESAIEAGKINAQLNACDRIEWIKADALEFLQATQDQYDLIVLDPPKLIPSLKHKMKGMRKYFQFNQQAIRHIAPNGILLSCSCSGALSLHEFRGIIQAAARKERRDFQIFKSNAQAPDHPVRLGFPESEYFKSIWLRAINF